MARVRKWVAVLVIAFLELAPGRAEASLKAVSKVTAEINFTKSETTKTVLSENRLLIITELRLRQAGFRVLTFDEDLRDSDINAAVEVNITLLKATAKNDSSLGHVFNTRLAVREYRLTPRSGAVVPLELWGKSFLNTSGSDDPSTEIERVLNEMLDQMINEWMKANSP